MGGGSLILARIHPDIIYILNVFFKSIKYLSNDMKKYDEVFGLELGNSKLMISFQIIVS